MSSVLLFAGCLSVAAAALGWAAGQRAKARYEEQRRGAGAGALAGAEGDDEGELGLGDVLTRPGGEDAVLEGALDAREGETRVLSLFFGTGGVIVGAFPAPRTGVLWLRRADDAPKDTPSVLSTPDGELDRKTRATVSLTGRGVGAPSLGSEAVLAEYASATGAAILLVGPKGALLTVGEAVAWSDVERLPGA